MKKFINIATALSLAAAMASCSMTENTPARHDLQDKQRLHDIRNSLPETIRIFDPGEFFPTDTKSDLGLPVDIQSDALDYDNASALSNSLYDYVQIPIHASTPLDYASVRFPLIPDGKTPSETAASKTFLIVQSPKDSSWTAAYTVTIIPHPDYMTPMTDSSTQSSSTPTLKERCSRPRLTFMEHSGKPELSTPPPQSRKTPPPSLQEGTQSSRH